MDPSVITNLDIKEYLSRRVEPLLIKGLKELAEKKPQNPIEYLAQFLIKNNTEFDEPQEQLKLKEENKPKFNMHKEKEYTHFIGQLLNREEEDQQSEQEEDEFNEEQENELKQKQLQIKEKGVRSGVSAEVFGEHNKPEDFVAKVIEKTEQQKQRINKRLSEAFMFAGLDDKEKETVINAMEEKQFKEGEIVIQQGDDGNNLYVVDQGDLECYKRYPNQDTDKFQKNYHPGESFGELALLYNTPRAATVKCTTDCVLFALDRDCFIHIVKDATVRKRLKYEELLASIKILKEMDPYDRSYLTDALIPKTIKQGDVIYKEGEPVANFFIIESGEISVTVNGKNILTLQNKDYFGELEVLTNSATRQVTVTAQTDCKLLGLESKQFEWLLFKPWEDHFRAGKSKYTI